MWQGNAVEQPVEQVWGKNAVILNSVNKTYFLSKSRKSENSFLFLCKDRTFPGITTSWGRCHLMQLMSLNTIHICRPSPQIGSVWYLLKEFRDRSLIQRSWWQRISHSTALRSEPVYVWLWFITWAIRTLPTHSQILPLGY